MRIIVFLVAIISLFLTGCQVIEGSGKIEKASRHVSEFEGVSLSGIGELTIIQGDEQSVLIEAEDNILPYIETDVHKNILHIGIKEGVALQNNKPLKYTVTTPHVNLLDVSGVGSITADSIQTKYITLDVSGSGEISVNNLDSDAVTIQISGTGDVLVQGMASEQVVDISGAGSYAALELLSEDATVTVSGTGDALVWATTTLSVDISGAGKVAYQGDPDVNRTISGVGTVQQIAGR